jgi:hypothetical protein
MSNEASEQDPYENTETASQPLSTPADIESLQAELAELRRQMAEVEAEKAAQGHRWRRFAVALLIALGCIVAIGANAVFWLRGTILNTNDWVATVAPLSRNEVIVNTLSGYVVAEVFDAIDVEQVAQELLPERIGFLSRPLVGALQDAVGDVVANIIKSDQFNAVWVTVNRAAHELAIGILRGDGQFVYVQGGQLTVDLSDLFAFLQSTLGLEDLGLFADREWGKFVLLESQQVAALQQALATLDAVGLFLPFLALALLVVAWLLSLSRRRTLLWIGAGIAITMAVTLFLLALAQPMVLTSIADPLFRALAGEIWDIITRGLVIQTILLLVIGLLIATGATLAGPHPRAVAIRVGIRNGLSRLAK